MLSRLSSALIAGSLLAQFQLCSSVLRRFKEFIFSWIRALGGCWIGQGGSAFSIDVEPADCRRLDLSPVHIDWTTLRCRSMINTAEKCWVGALTQTKTNWTELSCTVSICSLKIHITISPRSSSTQPCLCVSYFTRLHWRTGNLNSKWTTHHSTIAWAPNWCNNMAQKYTFILFWLIWVCTGVFS